MHTDCFYRQFPNKQHDSHEAHVMCRQSTWKIQTHPQRVCCISCRYLSDSRSQEVQTFITIFADLLWIHLDEKCIGIILVSNCTCVKTSNFGYFLVSVPSREIQYHYQSLSQSVTEPINQLARFDLLIHWELLLLLRNRLGLAERPCDFLSLFFQNLCTVSNYSHPSWDCPIKSLKMLN